MRGAVRYERLFSALADRGEGAFVPFGVLGDPGPETSLEIIRTFARSGADAVELGIPFSDPVADGVAIQAADLRALSAGTRVADAWRIVATVREEFPELPIGLLVYANLVLHAGAEAFFAQAERAGVDSVLVADLPLIESPPVEAIAAEHGIAPIFIASPNASDERIREIATRSRGYVYVTTRPGVTGAETEGLRDDAARVIRRLRQIDSTVAAPPSLLGFGIGRPEHVKQAITMGAAGAITGSAIATRIAEFSGRGRREEMLTEIGAFVRIMKAATLPSSRT
jgi:tryptophan synthase alpha chain